jgi:hypothetical protein
MTAAAHTPLRLVTVVVDDGVQDHFYMRRFSTTTMRTAGDSLEGRRARLRGKRVPVKIVESEYHIGLTYERFMIKWDREVKRWAIPLRRTGGRKRKLDELGWD